MYHPFDEGQFWPESHYPKVKIFRRECRIEITLLLSQELHQKFQDKLSSWTYVWNSSGEWIAYPFNYYRSNQEALIPEIRALNNLLNFCYMEGGGEDDKSPTTNNPQAAQLALVQGENPQEFQMSAFGLWAKFSAPVTQTLQNISQPHPLEEWVSSRMRGAYKIFKRTSRSIKLLRRDNTLHLYQGGNPLPILKTFGNCACLSATSNGLDTAESFTLSPHNVDSHYQQFLLMVGTLVFWQRMRKMIHTSQ